MTEEEIFQQKKEQQASFTVGTANKKEDKNQKNYELLLDNQVDFVKSDLLEGVLKQKLQKMEKKKNKREKKGSVSSSAEGSDSDLSEGKIMQEE